MSKNHWLIIGGIAAIFLISTFFAMTSRSRTHTWTLDTLDGPEFVQSALANREGLSDVRVAKDRGLLTVTYVEKNSLFRAAVDVPTVLKEVGGKEARVVNHTRD